MSASLSNRKEGRKQTPSTFPISVAAVGVGVDALREAVCDSEVQWALLRFEVGGGTFSRVKLVAITCNGDETPPLSRSRQIQRNPEVLRGFGDVNATIEINTAKEITHEKLNKRVLAIFGGDHLNLAGLPRSPVRSAGPIGIRCKSSEASPLQVEEEKEAKGDRELLLYEHISPTSGDSVPPPVEDPTAADDDSSAVISKSLDKSAEDALALVSSEKGPNDWVLLQPEDLTLCAYGKNGLDEMKAYLSENLVLFGLLRLAFASLADDTEKAPGQTASPTSPATKRLVKHVFIHWVGPSVGIVKRGRQNARRSAADHLVRNFCAYALSVTAHRQEDITQEGMVAELYRLTTLDVDSAQGLGGYQRMSNARAIAKVGGVAWSPASGHVTDDPIEDASPVRADNLEDDKIDQSNSEKEGQVDALCGPSPIAVEQSQTDGLPNLQKAIEVVRSGNGAWTWVLLAPQNHTMLDESAGAP